MSHESVSKDRFDALLEEFPEDILCGTFIGCKDLNELLPAQRREYLKNVCAGPFSTIDFSMSGLQNEDLNAIYEGLIQREVNLCPYSLQLLNISSEDITELGLKYFLLNLQRGTKGRKRHIYADVRRTIIRVGFSISNQFLSELLAVAPSAFAGALRLIN